MKNYDDMDPAEKIEWHTTRIAKIYDENEFINPLVIISDVIDILNKYPLRTKKKMAPAEKIEWHTTQIAKIYDENEFINPLVIISDVIDILNKYPLRTKQKNHERPNL